MLSHKISMIWQPFFFFFTELTEGKHQLIFQMEKLNLADKEAAIRYMQQYTMDVCNFFSGWFDFSPFGRLKSL